MSLKKFQFIQEDLKNLLEKVDVSQLTPLKGTSVCITGCAGFVGTWLCELINYLNTQYKFNTKVYALDRDIEKIRQAAPHLFNSQEFEFKKADVRYLSELPKETQYIIHAAGIPDNREHESNPYDVMTTSAAGTESLLKVADRLSDLRMFVNLSSALVYGGFQNREKPVKESDPFIGTTFSSYIAGKVYSEALTIAFRQQYRVPSIIIRPFTFLGPYQTLSSPWALNNFIRDALDGGTIKILGTGKTSRSFLYGSDVAFWILRMTLSGDSGAVITWEAPKLSSSRQLLNM
jgi:dTDP-glucose 4,6-dehydratase